MSSRSVSQIFKILLHNGGINIFVLRGVFLSRYVQLKSSFSDQKTSAVKSEIWQIIEGSFQWTSESDAGLWISEFLTKDVSKCIVNPTYLIGCCDSTLINLVLKTFLLIFNTTHKMGCCEYCYWLGWYNIRRVKSGSLNYPFLG